MKDVDFILLQNCKEFLNLEQTDAQELLDQVTRDTEFLASENIMDYSLLLAVEQTNYEEGNYRKKFIEMLDLREKKSFRSAINFTRSHSEETLMRTFSIDKSSILRGTCLNTPAEVKKDWKIISECGGYIYHLSLIDYLQLYNTNKKLERWGKMIKYGLKSQSTPLDMLGMHNSSPNYYLSSISPSIYKERFIDFI